MRPQQTEGPYFLDEKLNRSDIRSDPADGTIKPGIPLELAFRVSRVAEDGCAPLAGVVVDVWQCDARGVYSGVRDFAGRFDTSGTQFLRGYRLTDADGEARFVTIYPGWYPGRLDRRPPRIAQTIPRNSAPLSSTYAAGRTTTLFQRPNGSVGDGDIPVFPHTNAAPRGGKAAG